MGKLNAVKKCESAALALTFLLAAILTTSFPALPAEADSGYTLPPSTQLIAAAYGNGVCVVAGYYTVSNTSPPVYNSLFLTSPDGVAWTMQPALNNIHVDDITYGNGLFVAIGAGAVLTSSDGVHWNQNGGFDIQLNSIVYGNGRFVLMGHNENYTSTDGMNWTPIPNHAPFTQTAAKLIFSNGIFVDFESDGSQFATSQDGVNWQVQDTGLLDTYKDNNIGVPTISVAGLAYGNGMYVAVGMFDLGGVPQGTSPIIITSPDAVKWTMKMMPYTSYYPYNIRQLTFGDGIFAAIDRDGDIMTSPDCITWTVRDTGARGEYEFDSWPSGAAINTWDSGEKVCYNMVSFCGNEFVALGGVTFSTSEDGINWTNQQSNPVAFPAQTPVKFVVGLTYYYLGSKAASMPMMDAAPCIDSGSGRTLVPVRYLAIALGAITYWDAHTQTITITSDSQLVYLVWKVSHFYPFPGITFSFLQG